MGKKLVRKVLELLRKMSDAETEKEGDDEGEESAEKEGEEKETSYAEFWKAHGNIFYTFLTPF
jgi:hypothetical protein